MRLSEAEKKVFGAVDINAQITTSEIAKITKLRPHTVTYALKRLIDRGIIGAKKPSINLYPTGISQYEFFIRLANSTPRSRKDFASLVKNNPAITWAAEIGGNYHYVIAIAATDSVTAYEIFSKLRSECKSAMTVSLSVLLRIETYKRGHISSTPSKVPYIWYGGKIGGTSIDADDKRILASLFKSDDLNIVTVSKETGIPVSTVARRIKALEDKEIITGYYRFIDPIALGFRTFNINIKNLHGDANPEQDPIIQFARNHPNIVHCIKFLGAWDYNLVAEAEDIRQISGIIDELSEHIGSPIDANILPVFEYIKYKPISA